MADNKVTIDAAWFAEIYAKANAQDAIRKEAHMQASEILQLRIRLIETEKERNELKAKLDAAEVDREAYKDRAEAAERCIEDVYDVLKESVITDCGDGLQVYEIIRAYREAKEAR